MLNPKPQRTRRFWESVADEDLLAVELTTDDPESLPGVVYELPDGDEEPYVEYKYDLRKSDREMLRCVHGNHPHLAGYVMRKGKYRFCVGHICGRNIYGEDFEHYTSDFDTAVHRRDALRRTRDLRDAMGPCMRWLEGTSKSDVFKHFARVRGEFRTQVPWIYENYQRIAALTDPRVTKVELPKSILTDAADPRATFARIMSDFSSTALMLVGDAEQAARNLPGIKTRLDVLLKRIDKVFAELEEVELVFQPAVLTLLCTYANSHDNPRQRKYEPGLLSLIRGANAGRLPPT